LHFFSLKCSLCNIFRSLFLDLEKQFPSFLVLMNFKFTVMVTFNNCQVRLKMVANVMALQTLAYAFDATNVYLKIYALTDLVFCAANKNWASSSIYRVLMKKFILVILHILCYAKLKVVSQRKNLFDWDIFLIYFYKRLLYDKLPLS